MNTMNAQLNDQLSPRHASRSLARRAGLGATSQAIYVSGDGTYQAVPAPANSLLTVNLPSGGGAVTVGQPGKLVPYTGVKSVIPLTCPQCQLVLDGTPGSVDFSWTDPITFASHQVTVQIPGAAPTKIVPLQPKGPACPAGQALVNGKCEVIVSIGSKGNGKTTSGASVFQFVQGHRIKATTAASGGAAFPSDYQNQTVSSLQAQMNVATAGMYNFVSVSYVGGALVAVFDYAGPTHNIATPVTEKSGGVTVFTNYEDEGPSPSSGTMSSGKKIAIVAASAVAVAGGGWALWKYGLKRR